MSRFALSAVLVGVLACSAPGTPPSEITGLWGGDDAGLVVSDSDTTHVHIGCNSGNVPQRISPDPDGRFDVAGEFTTGAHPVGPGTVHPARFRGRVTGTRMTLEVVLLDTAEGFGPVTLTLGREPVMGPCPICRPPADQEHRATLPTR